MKRLLLAIGFLISLSSNVVKSQNVCTPPITENTCFKSGENVSFYVFYTLAGVWVHAGTAKFVVTQERLNNKPVWHFDGTGTSLSNYDFIYKVRDRYQSYVDTTTMQPLKFVRNVDEGKYTKSEVVTFNKGNNTANTADGKSFKVPNCIHDVMSQVYYARNINYDKYKVNDTIPYDIFLDNEIHRVYIRYLGRETIKSRYGKFKCLKFKPLLLKSSMFEGGEKMTVWVSDDLNRLPIRIESGISVGSVKVDMMMYQNLKYPLTSLIKI
jgi:hypothetical protein